MIYYPVLIALLASIIPPAALIVCLSGVRTPRQLWRRPEVAIALGFLLDAVRRFALITLPPPYGFPPAPIPNVWAALSVVSLGISSAALWARATAMIRHHFRNRDLARQGRQLREQQSQANPQE